MKYSEAKETIKSLSSKYSIDMDDGDFNVTYKETKCYVSGNRQYIFRISDGENFKKLPFSNKLYMILAKLAMTPLDERAEVKKYYVKAFNNEFGYLNINILTGKVTADNKSETDSNKTKFTSKAIKQLKRRDDVALDWNKVTLEEANEN